MTLAPHLDHPANRAVVSVLRQLGGEGPRGAGQWMLDGVALRTDPELHERLSQLAEELPEPCVAGLHGHPVLVTGRGLVFAIALGRSSLLFRLPSTLREEAQALGGRPAVELGAEWMAFEAWDDGGASSYERWSDLVFWCQNAYRHAREEE